MDWCRLRAQLTLWSALLLTVSWASRDLEEISYRFTSCGRTGREVPSPERCAEYYSEIHSPLIRDNLYVPIRDGYVGAQGFRVPRAGLYNITVAGAAGGRGLCNPEIGQGLVQKIQVELSLRYELLVLVGQRGLGPCSIDTPPAVCSVLPTRTDEIAACFNQWFYNYVNNSNDGGEILASVGGAGGGGASMVWPRLLLGENGRREVTELPLVISGGGGGSSTVLTYSCTVEDLGLRDYLPLGVDGESYDDQKVYKEFLNAKQDTYHPRLGYRIEGVRGFRDPSILRRVNAGTGGGWMSVAGAPVGEMDGGRLSDANGFAGGGIDCATLLQAEFDIPITGMHGGFGGGGGGCGGGGGGGGYTGGSVLWNGTVVSKKIPGSGGHSYFGEAPPANLNITQYFGHSLNAGRDGYVEIVPADCGCAFECVTEEEQYECLCPNDTQLAPDLSDCFQAAELDVEQGPSMLLSNLDNVEDLYVTPLSFNETATFIFSINLTVSTITLRATRQATGQGTCAVVFIGQDSEVILTSNVVMGSGTVNSLAIITTPEEEQTLLVSEYTDFLNSSILVTGAVLISSQPCSVEGMSFGVNSSIRETDTESLEYQEILGVAANITSETARNILQLSVPSESSESSTSTRTVIIAVVVPVGVVGITALILLVILLLRWRSQRKKKFLIARTPSVQSNIVTAGFASVVLKNDETSTGALEDHAYELLSYEKGEHELLDPVSDKFASKYGVNAPFHDFTDYNKQRSVSQLNDWEYPRSSLIFMRNLGEGQFGKVLLMKAKGIAGYQGYIPVAVKTLSTSDPEVVRKFMEEAELMKKFSHPNIVSLLGITSKDEDEDSSPLLILEYMPHGDLQSFLESHSRKEAQPSAITESDLYSFAIDIARALEFLEQSKYIHRDVAARNCLVGSGLRVKIADFGLARGVYNKDYYRVAGRALLPVRWMAPESILYGIFTSASDVWSYGVVLFEIMTYGERPLESMSVQNIVEEAQNGTLQHPRPKGCPDIIYDAMSQCHNHDKDQRPTFTEILAMLEVIRSDSCVSVRI